MNGSSYRETLILTPYEEMASVKNLYFIVVFLIYLASIMANISIMCLIYFDTALHKPMYMFLFSLLLNGLIGSTAVWPKVMVILLTGDNTNSVEGCLIQAFFMITRVSDLYGICVFVCFGVVPILLIFLSYLKIILLSLKISRNSRKKAFETCTPHLIIFINFSFVSIFFVIYVRFYPNFQHLFLSVSYNLFPPLLHPLVYGIRNKETRQSFSKIRRKVIFALGCQTTSNL
ncbi:olfactory receptor 10K1-like [Alosa sapidissima]|uniref:olfactory receptor 10K1-like n=1 Tax=Alosa sapidissima TaxID=34773 RepID=UPI001C0958E5|nr:olfactory receptor 10K1-like [Alosa sapidissima]